MPSAVRFRSLQSRCAALVLPACLAVSAAGLARSASAAPPTVPAGSGSDQVIVQLVDSGLDPALAAERLVAPLGGRVVRVYRSALHGFAAVVPAGRGRSLIGRVGVAAVEPDSGLSVGSTQTSPPWGLDRIDQAKLPLNKKFATTESGAGVTAYVIDTGIRLTHADFGGRAVSGVDLVDGGTADDCNGHGTHVAGTIGGARSGVAKKVALVAVRVLDCTGGGSTSTVLAGIDWVTAHHTPGSPAVANMSLGGSASTILDAAVRRSIASGVVYAVAAGNGDPQTGAPQDACGDSPSRVRQAITVSATDRFDARAPWANIGSCVDLFAPGVDISSDWDTSDSARKVISGTSMATPHVAGAAALFLQVHPSATPDQVAGALLAAATPGVVTNAQTRGALLLRAPQ